MQQLQMPGTDEPVDPAANTDQSSLEQPAAPEDKGGEADDPMKALMEDAKKDSKK